MQGGWEKTGPTHRGEVVATALVSPVDLSFQLAPRLALWLPEVASEPSLFPLLAAQRPMFAVAYIKTLRNGCPVGQRHGERLHACPFCSATNSDKMQHYIRCESMWSTIAHAAGLSAIPSLMHRLGLRDHRLDAVQAMYVTLDTYQSMASTTFPALEAINDSVRRMGLRM